MYFFGLPVGYRGRFGGGGSKKKAKKTPKATWFDECTVEQLKQLCKACKVAMSGTKPQLVQRLLEDDFVSEYSGNQKSRTPSFKQVMNGNYHGTMGDNVTLESLKEQCRARLLQVSGKKFDLVLRIVQHEKGTGGDTLKRAATEMHTITDPTSGEEIQEPVAKKRKKSKPSPSTLYNRVMKKIQAVSQKNYRSHWGSKSHAPDVCMLMDELIGSLDEYVDTDPDLVCDSYHAIVSSFVDNFSSMERPGYCEGLDGMVHTIEGNVLKMRSKLTDKKQRLQKLCKAMLDWKDVCSGYCMLDDHDMEATVRKIQKGLEGEADKKRDSTGTSATHSTEDSEEE